MKRIAHFPAVLAATLVLAQDGSAQSLSPPQFLQGGPGAVPRSWTDKARDVVNVKDFGALCNGAADDTAAIRRAVLYVTTFFPTGAQLKLPPGICLVSDGIDWPDTVPVNISGSGIWSTFLYQKHGINANGAIRVSGGKGRLLSGSVHINPKPTGFIGNLTVASDSGPAISLVDASNIVVDKVVGYFAHRDHAILDVNGGFINLFSNSWFGDSDTALPASTLALVAGHPTEKYSVRIEPRTHTVEGTPLRSVTTENQFVNVRFGYSATSAVLRIANPDFAVYGAFGFMLANSKLNCRTDVPAIELDNANLWMANTIIESSSSSADCIKVTGGNLDIVNSDVGGVLKTIRGSTPINLRMTGGHVTSLNIDRAPIDRLQFRGVNMDVDPASVSPQFNLTANGTKDFAWEGNTRNIRVDTIIDSSYAGPRVQSDGTHNTGPMYELHQTKRDGGFTPIRIQLRTTSTGIFEVYDKTNNRQLLVTPYGQHAGVSADKGDADATLAVGISERTSLWKTPLTADRTVALSSTNAFPGARLRLVRTVTATGAFNLNVGAGPLKALAAGAWAEFEHDGSAWFLAASGAL